MALSSAFNTAIAEKNITKIRIMLKDSMLVDPTFTRFQEMEKAARSVPGLYDEHDGRPFVEDMNLWTDDYMNRLMVQVVRNFSHERVEHLKKVVQKLRPVSNTGKDSGIQKMKVEKNGQRSRNDNPKQSEVQEGGGSSALKTAAGMIAGGLLGGIIATVASLSTAATVVCVAGGTALGAAVTYLGTRER